MKKLFYLIVFLASSAMVLTSCTEDEVTPSTQLDNGGGAINTGKI
jgi:hypothetical protein